MGDEKKPETQDGKACCSKRCCGGKALAAVALLAIGYAGGRLCASHCAVKDAPAVTQPAK
jgi:hypothetical protein